MNPKSLNLTSIGLMTIMTTILVGFSSTEISAHANEVRYPVDSNRQAIEGSLVQGDKVSPDLLIQQGKTAIKDRDWRKAETIWQQVIQLQPNNADAYSNLCEVLARLDKLDRAKEQCQKAIDLDPKLAHAYSASCQVLSRRRANSKCPKDDRKTPKIRCDRIDSPFCYFFILTNRSISG